jgi:hypothetical protein
VNLFEIIKRKLHIYDAPRHCCVISPEKTDRWLDFVSTQKEVAALLTFTGKEQERKKKSHA